MSVELPPPEDRWAADAWLWYRRYSRWADRADKRRATMPDGTLLADWCRGRADRQLSVFLTLMKGEPDAGSTDGGVSTPRT